jgi:hypothetical protein
MRSIRWISGIVLGGALTWACAEEPSGPSALMSGQPFGLEDCRKTNLANLTPIWGCNAEITVSGPAGRSVAIGLAMTEWNNALASDAVQGIPSFIEHTQGTIDLEIVDDGNGLLWCGQVDQISTDPIQLKITMTADTTACTHEDGYKEVLIHEFAHVLGYDGVNAQKVLGVSEVSDHCAIHLEGVTGVNDKVCQHEVEYVYQAYDQRAGGSVNWGKDIVTGINMVSGPISIEEEETYQLTWDTLIFNRGQTRFRLAGSTTTSWATMPQQGVVSVDTAGLVEGLAWDLIRSSPPSLRHQPILRAPNLRS